MMQLNYGIQSFNIMLGGGTTPGVSGGGGGGSSFVYTPNALDYLVVLGLGSLPGGSEHDPPNASGVGEWDTPGGPAGQGGVGGVSCTRSGNAGAIRIIKPGFY